MTAQDVVGFDRFPPPALYWRDEAEDPGPECEYRAPLICETCHRLADCSRALVRHPDDEADLWWERSGIGMNYLRCRCGRPAYLDHAEPLLRVLADALFEAREANPPDWNQVAKVERLLRGDCIECSLATERKR